MTRDDMGFARVKLRRRRQRKPEAETEEEEEAAVVEEGESDSDEASSVCSRRSVGGWSQWVDAAVGMAEKKLGIARSFLLLYSGYCISCIGDRLWTFAIVFILERLGGMRLVCINQLFESISAMFLASYVGNWLDRNDRRRGTLTVLFVNNISVAISAAMLYVCLTVLNAGNWVYITCVGCSIIFCSLSKCASEGEKLSFTKDWIVVLAKREGVETLSKRNAIMTVIDQTSSVIAPIITSYALAVMDYHGACVFFVGVNLFFWVIERALLAKVYSDVEELHVRERSQESDPALLAEIQLLTHGAELSVFQRFGRMLHAYWRQSVFPAAFGLALLYMTVLGFDGLAISHGKAQQMPDEIIGWFRSVGSVLGILGAASYTGAERRLGVRRTGLLGLVAQQLCLYLCVLSIVLPGTPFDPRGYFAEFSWDSWWWRFRDAFRVQSPANGTLISATAAPPSAELDWANVRLGERSALSVLAFFAGLTFARWGLWMADLSITQIMQEKIREEERGTVFGVQNALCQFFSVLKDILVILFPDARLFGFFILMSITFVTIGFIHYCYYLFKNRGDTPQKSRAASNLALHSNGKSKSSKGAELCPLTDGLDAE